MDIVNINGIDELNSFLRAPDKQTGIHLALFQLGNAQSLLQVNRETNQVAFIDKFDRPMMPNMREVILNALPKTTQILDVSREKRRENIYDPQGFSAKATLDSQDPAWQQKATQILATASLPKVEVTAKEAARPGLSFWNRRKTAVVAPAQEADHVDTHKPGVPKA
jgi:hypothetical protein